MCMLVLAPYRRAIRLIDKLMDILNYRSNANPLKLFSQLKYPWTDYGGTDLGREQVHFSY